MTKQKAGDWAERTMDALLKFEQLRPFHIRERIIRALRRAEKRGYERGCREGHQGNKPPFVRLSP